MIMKDKSDHITQDINRVIKHLLLLLLFRKTKVLVSENVGVNFHFH